MMANYKPTGSDGWPVDATRQPSQYASAVRATGYGARVSRPELETFKRQWPCHGLPDNLWRLHFYFDTSGDLVDLVACARNGRPLDTAAFDGPALAALALDAQFKMNPQHAYARGYT